MYLPHWEHQRMRVASIENVVWEEEGKGQIEQKN